MNNIIMNEYMNKYKYTNVLNELTKKFWTDFDYHRERMTSTLNKLEQIIWIEIDYDLCKKITNPIKQYNMLECSRYTKNVTNVLSTGVVVVAKEQILCILVAMEKDVWYF